ncbi:hypothetical protein CEXT_456631 [Caerostris extrusa]|uniref:Uncharacterized protein n=1 Tax=Caerostris extrusa TaxID=172846 RepID=A0AAV4MMU9_CAEEX|nr:hypothetical protein CEXT_456631 [Caerostris extrusa]
MHYFFTSPLSDNELPIMAPSIYRVVLAKDFLLHPQQNDTVSIDDINDVIKTSAPLCVICPGKLLKRVSRGWETQKEEPEEH